jgi:hypothetical protein
MPRVTGRQLADRGMELAGETTMPGPPDPMTSATTAMRRVALERPPGGEMPKGGMPEHEIEGDVGEDEGSTA